MNATAKIAALCVVVVASACSGAANDVPGKTAAIQALLDSSEKRPAVMVPNGKNCPGWMSTLPTDIAAFQAIKEVHVSKDGACYDFTWDASALILPGERMGPLGPVHIFTAPVGRYIVDKVGDEADGPAGTKITPYKAHFEKNAIGPELLAAHEWNGKAGDDITDGQAVLHKDADGKWIAQ